MYCIGAVIKVIAHFQYHPLVYIETLRSDLIHYVAIFPGIDDSQLSNTFSNSHNLAVGIAGWALMIVYKQNFFTLHADIPAS